MTMALDNAGGAAPQAEASADAQAGKRTRSPKRRGVPTWRLIDWRVILGALIVGGLLHISIVMLTPLRHGNGSLQRLRSELPANRPVLVVAPVPQRQPMSFMVPDAAYVLCRFDLSVDSLRVSTALLDHGWVLSLHTASGDNFYVMPGQAKRTDVAFVLMPEHVHLLVYPTTNPVRIDRLLSAIKQPYSVRIRTILEENHSPLLERLMVRERPGKWSFRYWQEGPGYDRNFNTEAATWAAIDYIHLNPVRRGLVERIEDWRWSSARWYLSDRKAIDPAHPVLHGLPPEFWTPS